MKQDIIKRRFGIAGVILTCLVASAAAKAADSIPQTVSDAQALIQQSLALAKVRDSAGTEAKLRLVLDSPIFPQLSAAEQYGVLTSIGEIELWAKNFREALNLLKRACETPAPRARAWMDRLSADRELDDVDGVETLTVLAKQAPQILPKLNPYLVIWAAEKSVQMSDDATIAAIGALQAAHWQNPERYDATDTIWLYLARAYLDRGDVKNATAAMADVTSVASIVAARSEKLFDPLVTADPAHYDIAKATDAEIAKYRKWAQEDPDRLAAATDLTRMLTQAGRLNEAIAVADAALAHLRSGAAPPFKDKDRWLSNLMDARSEALFDANRIQEALDQMAEGAHVLEYGQPNVDQVIDLADYYMAAGKPRDALAAVAVLDPKNASPYGLMAAASVRACSYAQLHDTKRLAAEMTYMRGHADDAPTIMFDTYICAGDMDSAAAAAIGFMRNPLTRSRMLVEFQDYAGGDETPMRHEYKRKYLELRNRPDVAVALSAIGHINTYTIYQPNV